MSRSIQRFRSLYSNFMSLIITTILDVDFFFLCHFRSIHIPISTPVTSLVLGKLPAPQWSGYDVGHPSVVPLAPQPAVHPFPLPLAVLQVAWCKKKTFFSQRHTQEPGKRKKTPFSSALHSIGLCKTSSSRVAFAIAMHDWTNSLRWQYSFLSAQLGYKKGKKEKSAWDSFR